jgi:hypothetical protein
VWAVTAVDANGKRYSQANRATHAAWAAPGVELWVPFSGTNDGAKGSIKNKADSSYVSGTSFATALASAALAWQAPQFWGLTAIAQKIKICELAMKVQNDPFLGCGVLQISTLNEYK